jgi:colanic acid biosynthesis glycosyl transferase WcaI
VFGGGFNPRRRFRTATENFMRVLLITLNYLPESTSIGPYSADLAQYLRARGHQVQVLTSFPLAPQWHIWEGYRGKAWMRQVINGVPVLRTWIYIPAQPKKSIQRILFDLSYALTALLGGLFAGRADLIVAVSPPLQLGLTAWLLSSVKRAPFFLHIQDLVPDAAVLTGMLREGSIPVRVARALEGWVYARACGIGVICDGFVRNLRAKGIAPDKVALLPNSIDLETLAPLPRDNGFRQQQNIASSEWLVMYSGSVALKQGLHTLVETAARFSPGDGVCFLLVGEGPYLGELEALASALNLPHLRLLPLQPRAMLPAQLCAADVLVITQRRAVTDVVFPGKLLYYMAAGRPILAAVSADSETGRFIEKNQVGIVVPPEDPQALADAIYYLKQNPSVAKRLGQNGRRVVEEQFDRRMVLERFADHLEHLVGMQALAKVQVPPTF